MNYSPSINLMYDVVDCLKKSLPEFSSAFSVLIAKELSFRYVQEKLEKPDEMSHNFSNGHKLCNYVNAHLVSVSTLMISSYNIKQIIRTLVETETAYSTIDKLRCFFWFLERMNLSDGQYKFLREAIKDLSDDEFIEKFHVNFKYPADYFDKKIDELCQVQS